MKFRNYVCAHKFTEVSYGHAGDQILQVTTDALFPGCE